MSQPNVHKPQQLLIDRSKVFLVIDDTETMRDVTAAQLKRMGAGKVVVASNGAEGLRILRSQKIDIVLSDWAMPVMSGLDLLRTVRADETLCHLPFVLITAESGRQRVEQAVANGVTSMMIKPYTPNQLLERVLKALEAKHRKAPQELTTSNKADSTRAEAPSGRPSLLIVDDTHDNLLLLSQMFKDNYRVRLALNGEKALEICQSEQPPDMVLLDIMMPGMDGFEVARRMREHPTSETIPIIFVTAMTSQDARMRGLDLGAVDFVTKPVNPDELKPRVHNFMRYVNLRRELQSEFDDLVEMAKLREDVDQMTRHDLKGPLAGALGVLQGLLQDTHLDAGQTHQIKLAEEALIQVMGMVNQSSELFKIETGRFQLQARDVDVAGILKRLVAMNRAVFSAKQLDITFETTDFAAQPTPSALGDTMLCYSLFQNLLKNACEAAPPDSSIGITLHDTQPLRVTISNRGAVPAAIRARFFDKFVTQGKSEGTGLGTYSARLLAQAQNGTVDMTVSDEADTTTLTITLPRHTPAT